MAVCALQRGHLGRRSGNTGTPGEVEYNVVISKRVMTKLESEGIEVWLYGADDVPRGLRCDAFLALHCDGAKSPDANGFSLGYPDHLGDAGELARCLRQSYGASTGIRFRGYNITRSLRCYYAFSRVKARGRAVIELGFLTNPSERCYLLENAELVAEGVADGLLQFLALGK